MLTKHKSINKAISWFCCCIMGGSSTLITFSCVTGLFLVIYLCMLGVDEPYMISARFTSSTITALLLMKLSRK